MISKSKKRRLRRQKMASLSPWKQDLQSARKSLVTAAAKEASWSRLRSGWGSTKVEAKSGTTAGMSLYEAVREASNVDR